MKHVDFLAQSSIDRGPGRRVTHFAGVDIAFDTDPPLIPGAHGTGNNQIFAPNGQTFEVGLRFGY